MKDKIAVVCQCRSRAAEIICNLIDEFQESFETATFNQTNIHVVYKDGGEILWVDRSEKLQGRKFNRMIIDAYNCRKNFFMLLDEVERRVVRESEDYYI